MTSIQSFSDIFMLISFSKTSLIAVQNIKKMTWMNVDYVLWRRGVVLFPLISSDAALSSVIYDSVIYRIC